MHASAPSNYSVHWLYTRPKQERRRVKERDDGNVWLDFCDHCGIDAEYRPANMLPLKSHCFWLAMGSAVHCKAWWSTYLCSYYDFCSDSDRIDQLFDSSRQGGTLLANQETDIAVGAVWELAQFRAWQRPNLLQIHRNQSAAEHIQQSTIQSVLRLWRRFEWQIAQRPCLGATYFP